MGVRTWSALAAVLLVAVAGCTSSSTSGTRSSEGSSSAESTTPSTTVPAPPPTSSTPTSTPPTGGAVVNDAGAILPNPQRTPGATNPDVTPATIDTTICVSGWTATVRPPESYTTQLKEEQLASGYAYHGDPNKADYEEDHLISLEIGGSPTSPLNLWPEPYAGPEGARVKDQLENRLHTLVCAEQLSLATAQRAIATDWYAAYVTYLGHAPVTQLPPRSVAAPPTSARHVSALTCSASMSNSSPAQYSSVDVLVHTVADASVIATAHYKTTDTSHPGVAGPDGLADIAFHISRATVGFVVSVDVTVTARGSTASCSTAFTPS